MKIPMKMCLRCQTVRVSRKRTFCSWCSKKRDQESKNFQKRKVDYSRVNNDETT